MKAFFLSRVLREKVLLVVFLCAAALIWLSSISTRAGLLLRQARDTSDDLAAQKQVLNREQAVNVRARASIQQLVAEKTLGGIQLQQELDNLARQSGIKNPTLSDLVTKSTGQFAINTVQFEARGADYKSLVDFYAALSKKVPYIGVDQITLRIAPNSTLSTSIKVSSVEILSGAR